MRQPCSTRPLGVKTTRTPDLRKHHLPADFKAACLKGLGPEVSWAFAQGTPWLSAGGRLSGETHPAAEAAGRGSRLNLYD